MNSRILGLLFVTAIGTVIVGVWLGGWRGQLPEGKVQAMKAVAASPVKFMPPVPPSRPSPVSPLQPPVLAPPLPPTAPAIVMAPSAPGVMKSNAATPSSGDTTSTMPSADLVIEAAIQIDKIGLMFRDYRTLMGENPVGTNAEIIQSVNGGNPKQAKLGPPEGQPLNARGELMDAWGTPYFFHQKSVTDMEIHSAGPDRQFGTPDDIIGR